MSFDGQTNNYSNHQLDKAGCNWLQLLSVCGEGVIKKNSDVTSTTEKKNSTAESVPENKGPKIKSSINTDSFPAKWF